MKKHLKASLGWESFNGSVTSAKKPTSDPKEVTGAGRPSAEANGSDRTKHGSIRSDREEVPRKIAETRPITYQEDETEAMPEPRKEIRKEKNNGKEKRAPVTGLHTSSDEEYNGEQVESVDSDVPGKASNGLGKSHADGGTHRQGATKEYAGALAQKIFEKRSKASKEERTEEESSDPAKPKIRRRRSSKKHTPAKKPRENGDSREDESSLGDEGSSSSDTETATMVPECPKTPSPEFEPGDLLWSKIGQSPFWPCMVIEDPNENKFYEEKRDYIRYYVQYFGVEVTHGWTQSPNRVIPYRGVEAFKEFAKAQIAEVKSRQKFYDVEPKKTKKDRQNWNQALEEVAEAETIVPASERYKSLRFAFYPGGAKTRPPNGVPSSSGAASSLPESSFDARPQSSASSYSTSSARSRSADSSSRSSSKSQSRAPGRARTKAGSWLSNMESGAGSGSKKKVFNNNTGE